MCILLCYKEINTSETTDESSGMVGLVLIGVGGYFIGKNLEDNK